MGRDELNGSCNFVKIQLSTWLEYFNFLPMTRTHLKHPGTIAGCCESLPKESAAFALNDCAGTRFPELTFPACDPDQEGG